MNRVFVLSCDQQPLDPCHPARARKLLDARRAAVFRPYPFTIILRQPTTHDPMIHPHRIKIDPGSVTSGLAIVQEETKKVVWAAELGHRGIFISKRLHLRAILRRARRSRKNRYRQRRYLNRRKRKGQLRPSMQSRVANIQTWVTRLRRHCPISALSLEFAKFDQQKMVNPEIQGVEYSQGERQGYEVREYLLEKWGRKCVYCGKKNAPLQIEHIVPKSRGGSNRIANLTLACGPCNLKKGNSTATEFGFPSLQAGTSHALKHASAVNTIRWALFRLLQATDLPLEIGTGAHTKFNRQQQGYPKTHWVDAACIGDSGSRIWIPEQVAPLMIKAMGHGKRQRCYTNKYGFPIAHAPRVKKSYGFQTGDIAKASPPAQIKMPSRIGRVVIRHKRPMFMLNRRNIHRKYLTLLQHADGYDYQQGVSIPTDPEENENATSTLESV